MTPTQHALHLLAFGASAVACLLLAPLSLLVLGAIGLAAFMKMATDASDTLDSLATA